MGDEKGVSDILKRGPLKKLGKKIFLASLMAGLTYVSVACIYGANIVYKVKTNYAVALETISGKRIIEQEVGWHGRAPFFTTYEKEISLMQKQMYLNGDITPHTVVSSDKISLLVSGLLTFRVTDPYKWAIEIQDSENQLQRDFNGIVKDVIQSSTESQIIRQREELKNTIFQKIKTHAINTGKNVETRTLEQKYGIEIVSFNITDAEYPKNLQEASQRKKELELIADGEREAILRTYQGHTEGVKKFMKETSLSKEEAINYLNQQRWASAYEKSKDQKTYVINSTNEKLGLTIPSEDGSKKDKKELEERINELEKKIPPSPGYSSNSQSPMSTSKKEKDQQDVSKARLEKKDADQKPDLSK